MRRGKSMQRGIWETKSGFYRCIRTFPLRSRTSRRFMDRSRRVYVLIVVMSVLLLAVSEHTDAHKPVTSKYDYNRDVFPLLQEHCGRCHVEGGAAPMSLMTYKDAVPWAQSIRDELTAGRMPPWPIDPTSPGVKGAHPITSRDLDMIVV